MIRQPHVAGQFYPGNASSLREQIEQLMQKGESKEEALGLVSPHAGYIYSGRVAACAFSRVKLTKSVVILGPNHTGFGVPFSIMTEGTWQMPMGEVEIDTSLAKKILAGSNYLQQDSKAHLYEHSIEVQLPFLQYNLAQLKIVPIIVTAADFTAYDEIGKSIAKAIKEDGRKVLIVATSDMSHYEPQEKAKANDHRAIEAILKLDAEELLKRVNKFNISMCGWGPVVCLISAAKELGAKQARLLKYETSGDASGDYSSVVGYAAIMIQ